MADPFVAEIRINGFNFAPTGWALCNGQLMPISQNTALFSLVGTYYGGDGRSTFGLPNLQGSFPMFWGDGPGLRHHDLGESGGAAAVTLLPAEMPAHAHAMGAFSPGSGAPVQSPGNASIARSPARAFRGGPPDTQLALDAVGLAGGNLPHNNMPPYLGMSFCIALQGIFPPRS